jgi:hypothetical protein
MVAPAWTLTVAQVTSVEVASAGVPRSWGHWRSTSRPIAVLWSLRPLLCGDGVGGVRFGFQARWRRRRAAKERLIATLLVGRRCSGLRSGLEAHSRHIAHRE